MRSLLLACVALLALPVAAQTPDPKAPIGDWRVVQLGDTPTTPDDDVTLSVTADQISGRAACNRYSAALRVDPDFGFGPLAMTRMFCPGRPAELEAAFLRLIEGVDGWQIEGDVLELSAGGDMVLRAERSEAP